MALTRKWEKVTFRTIPVYLLALALMFEAHPTPVSFLSGVVLILAGEAIRIWAAGHLEKNRELTTSGPYAYLKNPLYFGTFWIMLGFFLISRAFFLMAVGLVGFLIYYAPYKKRREGKRLLDRFGERWENYDRAVPDYFPRVTPYERRGRRRWSFPLVLENDEQGTAAAVLLGIAVLALRSWM